VTPGTNRGYGTGSYDIRYNRGLWLKTGKPGASVCGGIRDSWVSRFAESEHVQFIENRNTQARRFQNF